LIIRFSLSERPLCAVTSDGLVSVQDRRPDIQASGSLAAARVAMVFEVD
jgi:hypothetical protein